MNFVRLAHIQLIAKSIGELTYEQILAPRKIGDKTFELTFASGATYSFSGWMTIWEYLRVDESSIRRNGVEANCAGTFFLDAQEELQMDDIVLGNFLEEMHNSLYNDSELLKKQHELSARKIALLDGEEVQNIISGHPKILLSKGRLGWGIKELAAYSPENENPIKLRWIAVLKEHALFSIDENKTANDLLLESFDESALALFKEHLNKSKINLNDYIILPVHPWQWDRFIKIQYLKYVNDKTIVDLGIHGDEYLPQISLRTFRNVSRANKADIKLPISILNTSAVRGIPAKFMDIGPALSQILQTICSEDEILRDKGTDILKEYAGVSFEHPEFKKIAGAPYRYKEYLGAIYRESSHSKIRSNEMAVMTGALFYKDSNNNSLVGEYVKKAEISMQKWLESYFEHVVIPLYHLQLRYGIGLVAHGQNVMVKLTNFIPSGVLLKDFQGDLRLSTDSILLQDSKNHFVTNKLEKLPAHYLIHDLLTGHLVTVLRFVSATLKECDGLKEDEFYSVLNQVVRKYHDVRVIAQELSLLMPQIDRVLLNKVRFSMGYADTNQRLRPAVGDKLNNPLVASTNDKKVRYE